MERCENLKKIKEIEGKTFHKPKALLQHSLRRGGLEETHSTSEVCLYEELLPSTRSVAF